MLCRGAQSEQALVSKTKKQTSVMESAASPLKDLKWKDATPFKSSLKTAESSLGMPEFRTERREATAQFLGFCLRFPCP